MRPLFVLVIFGVLLGCAAKTYRPPDAEELNALPQYVGTLSGTTVWHDAVVMNGDVRIPVGSRLLINPGTRIYVRAAQGTKIDPEFLSSATELLIQGTLIIDGSAVQPVVFDPVDVPDGTDYSWAGIELIGATESRVSGAVLRNAESGILCIHTSPRLNDNIFTGCRYGVIAQYQSDPQLIDNRIEHGEGGVFCWRSSHPVLKGNQILGHAEEGIYIDADSVPVLEANIIRDNDIGLYNASPEVVYSQLQFSNNRVNIQLSPAIATTDVNTTVISR